jgi:hypothetical protein
MATNANPYVNNIVDLQNVSLDIRGINSSGSVQEQINRILKIVDPFNGIVYANALSNLTPGVPINIYGGINLSNSGLYSNGVLVNFGAGSNNGLPPGGNSGEMLVKLSDSNYDVGWSPTGSLVINGLYKVSFNGPSVFSTNFFDAANFPSRIGIWSIPTATTLTLTFNDEYYTLENIPNLSGNIYWWNGTVFKVNPIPTIGVSGAFPGATFTYSGTNWVMTYSITGTTYAASANNGQYGFYMYLNVFN